MKRVLVLQHAEPEHPGRISDALQYAQVKRDHIRCDLGEPVPSTLGDYAGLVVMGGPQSVYEEDRFPHLKVEKALVRDAIARDRPVLGVCLGSQILADVLGASVYSSGRVELGWKTVKLATEVAADPVLGHLPPTIVPFHWHGDIYDLPVGAKPIGASDMTSLQGFAWRERTYALLFHLEVTADQIVAMVRTFPDDVRRSGVEASALLAESPERLAAVKSGATETFRRWAMLL